MVGQSLYLDDLFSFFAIEPGISRRRARGPFPSPIREGFTFEDVGLPLSRRGALGGAPADFTLRAGEMIALVGENGAGKTTLVKLLARLYDPTRGASCSTGWTCASTTSPRCARNIGVIFQDFVRYELTAAENIAVGSIEARGDRARIVAAAERSLADEVIRRLPAGLRPDARQALPHGVDLSGGEWQKVAMARAYMRDAQLLILDEPTAALDARAEHEVFERFKELSEGRTAMLISHRFSTVRMADRILVLDEGAGRGRAPTPSCWPRAGATPSCSSCRRRGTVGHAGEPGCDRGPGWGISNSTQT